ncbi:protein of unknown function [Magnetospirillum gryphiswaldense MSR-1 v2]|uniref:Uncharacterized protein n=1 Tax=Magnetospirillum gryphiswaldense (strain DSM 6361 / JCM 21280 / NBRC 15271 / MSR-1) TaxID=431944 RepID=V6F102_MAGGM|nr:hypothetical protein [Magnetospirillum gryphiswaldense]CDK99134.1 protein of unknown function [Magnetospirillum gryphiswaldense MSR-1 v2]
MEYSKMLNWLTDLADNLPNAAVSLKNGIDCGDIMTIGLDLAVVKKLGETADRLHSKLSMALNH